MRWPVLLRIFLLAMLALLVVMFTIQNVSRTTLLSFDVYVYAWQLSRPVPVPWIIWGSFGSGVLLTLIIAWGRQRGLTRKVTRLEQEALLRSAGRAPGGFSPAAVADTPRAASPEDWGR